MFLEYLHQCAQSRGMKAFYYRRANEIEGGYLYLFKKEWPRSLKRKQRVPSGAKPMGEVMSALYEYCKEVAIYLPRQPGAEQRDVVNHAWWFRMCLFEIALCGGIVSVIEQLYPPQDEDEVACREAGVTNRQKCRDWLNKIATKIKNGEPPEDKESGIGYVGTLLLISAEHSLGSTGITEANKRFVTSFRQYIKGLAGPGYGIMKVDQKTGFAVITSDRKRNLEKVDVPEERREIWQLVEAELKKSNATSLAA